MEGGKSALVQPVSCATLRWPSLPLLSVQSCGLCVIIYVSQLRTEAQILKGLPASEKNMGYIVQPMFFSALCCVGKHKRLRFLRVSQRLKK